MNKILFIQIFLFIMIIFIIYYHFSGSLSKRNYPKNLTGFLGLFIIKL